MDWNFCHSITCSRGLAASSSYISNFYNILLTRISGINLLEARGLKKWKDDPAYLDYLNRTSILIPFPPKKD